LHKRKPPYVIGIDCGTQSLRSGIFDLEGYPIVFATKDYSTYFPRPGWAEQDADDWWEATVTTVRECLTKSGVSKEEIIGIAVDGTSSTVVPVDEKGNPISLRGHCLWYSSHPRYVCTVWI